MHGCVTDVKLYTILHMAHIIHARLDEETDNCRRELARRLGWTDSRIVREGIKSLAAYTIPGHRPGIVGIGQFESGVPDLGSNEKHLDGFGQ